MKGKVVVGMSGGVDSSVAAYLLKEEGYQVIGVTLKHLGDEDSENINTKTCCSLDDIYDAKMACFKLDIPHYVVSAVDSFEREVIDYFVGEYSKGITPSPCVICDEKIKIKKLVEAADKLGAEYISTGHYCDVTYSQELETSLLKLSKNSTKDQTYMLYRIGEEVLKRMLFPLKKLEKKRVREIAKEVGIPVHDKKDSQGICFAPKGYKELLKRTLGEKIRTGNFITKDGYLLGQHEGYQLYTIGQRRGLGIDLPKVCFITGIDPDKNEIILGDFEELMKKEVELTDTVFLTDIEKLEKMELLGRPRFSSTGLSGRLKKIDGRIFFIYDEENARNSPGQHMVIYYKDFVVGGGKIIF
ncbi:tRNA 2-thiouridine(34) synthase MnmA [uncultured Ilyobacter sp.]|uniref:tRNA 2-thiouridine(34) synthase MnmA n=1 Tax=uncultured Ilyobacter sp. TaxID=544433 RepID=UPI0029C79E34|nr:tRNA 2-thiouridine(34) synthase MnmA [uncultured Ilyobacter sp.]